MKPEYLLIPTALAMVLSCQRENIGVSSANYEMNGITLGNELIATKCTAGGEEVLFEDMPIVTSTGDTLYLGATLSNMSNVPAAETKGSPIADMTADEVFNHFYFDTFIDDEMSESKYYYKSEGTYGMWDMLISYDSPRWLFDKKYTHKWYWPSDDNVKLDFCSIAPSTVVDNKYTSSYGWDPSTRTYHMTYSCRKDDTVTDNDAVNMLDFMVGVDCQNKDSHEGAIQINFKHACVGVKFVIGDIFGNIEYISLKNFYRTGRIDVTKDSLAWSEQKDKSQFRQTYGVNADGTNMGADLDTTAKENKTFMLIPQVIPDDAEMIIKMGNTLHPEELSFSTIFTNNPSLSKNWASYQGKIIKFSVSSEKANNVSVTVTDNVVGHTKQDIVIKNDGKSSIMIRVKPVGNWLNEDGRVLAAWEEDTTYCRFTSKNGYPTLNNVNWKKSSDGFYYYKKYLKSGKKVSENLFDTFTVTSKPVDATGTWEQGGTKMKITSMELVLLVQAIIAEKDLSSFKAAWGTEMVDWIGEPVSDE